MKKIISSLLVLMLVFSLTNHLAEASHPVGLLRGSTTGVVTGTGSVSNVMVDGNHTTAGIISKPGTVTWSLNSLQDIDKIFYNGDVYADFYIELLSSTGAVLKRIASNSMSSRTDSTLSFDKVIGVKSIRLNNTTDSLGDVAIFEFDVYPAPVIPAVPTGLSGTPLVESVKLTWNPNTDPITGYNVYKNSEKVNTSPITSTEYIVTGLEPDANYSYQITSVNGGYESAKTTPAITLAAWAPEKKPILTATDIKDTSVRLVWDHVAISYDVFQDGAKITTTDNYFVNLTNLTLDTSYVFHVVALDKYGRQVQSDPITIRTAMPSPDKPLLTTTNVTHDSFTLNWLLDFKATDYDVYLDDVFVANTTDSKYVFTGLSEKTLYRFKVVSKGSGGTNDAGGSVTTAEKPIPAVTSVSLAPVPNDPNKRTLSYTTTPDVTEVRVYQNNQLIGTFPVSNGAIELDFSTITDNFVDLKVEPTNPDGKAYEFKTFGKSTGDTFVDQLAIQFMNLYNIIRNSFWYIAMASIPLILSVLAFFFIRRRFKRVFGESKKESAVLINQPSKPTQENIDFKEEKRKFIPWKEMTPEQKNEWRSNKGLKPVNYKNYSFLPQDQAKIGLKSKKGFNIKSKTTKFVPVGFLGLGGFKEKTIVTYEKNGVEYRQRYQRGRGKVFEPVDFRNKMKLLSNQTKAVKSVFTGSNKKNPIGRKFK